MRIVTFNTHHGLTPAGSVDTPALARWCADLGADVLALQEVDVGTRRSHRDDQAGAVARATGMAMCYGPARRIGVRGRYGNALLVRGSLAAVATVPLPWPGRHERRSAIVAEATVAGRTFSVAAAHLSVYGREAAVQLGAVLELVRDRPAPRLVAGDLNLRPAQLRAALEGRAMAVAGIETPSYPSDGPRLRIDHVLAEGLVVESVEVLPAGPVSDHRAVAVEVR